jgi:hypothetical protein
VAKCTLKRYGLKTTFYFTLVEIKVFPRFTHIFSIFCLPHWLVFLSFFESVLFSNDLLYTIKNISSYLRSKNYLDATSAPWSVEFNINIVVSAFWGLFFRLAVAGFIVDRLLSLLQESILSSRPIVWGPCFPLFRFHGVMTSISYP